VLQYTAMTPASTVPAASFSRIPQAHHKRAVFIAGVPPASGRLVSFTFPPEPRKLFRKADPSQLRLHRQRPPRSVTALEIPCKVLRRRQFAGCTQRNRQAQFHIPANSCRVTALSRPLRLHLPPRDLRLRGDGCRYAWIDAVELAGRAVDISGRRENTDGQRPSRYQRGGLGGRG